MLLIDDGFLFLQTKLKIDAETTNLLRDIIELTEDPKVAGRLAGIITAHQIYRSRLTAPELDTEDACLRACTLADRAVEWAG